MFDLVILSSSAHLLQAKQLPTAQRGFVLNQIKKNQVLRKKLSTAQTDQRLPASKYPASCRVAECVNAKSGILE